MHSSFLLRHPISIFIMIALAISGLLSLGYWQNLTDFPFKATFPSGSNQMTGFMKGVQFREYNQDGQLSASIFAKTAQQYHQGDDERIELTHPEIQLKRHQKQWHISAEKGQTLLRERQAKLQLVGQVVAEETNLYGEPISRLTTHSLELDPQTQSAKTQDPIKLTQGIQRLTATGLQADFKQGTISLAKDVRGHYVNSK